MIEKEEYDKELKSREEEGVEEKRNVEKNLNGRELEKKINMKIIFQPKTYLTLIFPQK